MLKFLTFDRQEYERILFGADSLKESMLWMLWATVCLVGYGSGPFWLNLLIAPVGGYILAALLAGVLAREALRYEWVDKAGICLSSPPSLVNRCLVLIYRASAIFIPVSFTVYSIPMGQVWIFKLIYAVIALIWFVAIVSFGVSRLWRLSKVKSVVCVSTSVLTCLLPAAYFGLRGGWSRLAINLNEQELFSNLEFHASAIVLILGLPSLAYTFGFVWIFLTRGSRLPEGQRRRKLMPYKMQASWAMGLLMITVPFSLMGAIHRYEFSQIRSTFERGDVYRVIQDLSDISPSVVLWERGVPYDADFNDLSVLIEFHKGVNKDISISEQLLQLAKRWWMLRPTSLTSTMTPDKIRHDMVTDHQRLLLVQLSMDQKGDFSRYMIDMGYVMPDVVQMILE